MYSWDLDQIDWFRDATTVPFGHLSIDLFPRTDGRLRYCTRSGNIPSKFYVPDNLKHLKQLDDEHTKSLYSPTIPALFPRMQNSVSKNLSKRIYPVSQRVHRQPAAWKLVRGKKKTRPKVQRRSSGTVFKKKTNWKQRRSLPSSQKGLLLIKTISLFDINHLS